MNIWLETYYRNLGHCHGGFTFVQIINKTTVDTGFVHCCVSTPFCTSLPLSWPLSWCVSHNELSYRHTHAPPHTHTMGMWIRLLSHHYIHFIRKNILHAPTPARITTRYLHFWICSLTYLLYLSVPALFWQHKWSLTHGYVTFHDIFGKHVHATAYVAHIIDIV